MNETAEEYFRRAYEAQMAGDLDRAVRLYMKSIELNPTAEAHTFLGWTYSFQRKYKEAIAECHKAIQVDPDFGNPYNDIGVYLMQQGKLDEAILWLGKAKQARRYEPRQFPFRACASRCAGMSAFTMTARIAGLANASTRSCDRHLAEARGQTAATREAAVPCGVTIPTSLPPFPPRKRV